MTYGLERNDVMHAIRVDRGRQAMGLCGHVFTVIQRTSSPDPNRLCHGCLWRQQRASPTTQE